MSTVMRDTRFLMLPHLYQFDSPGLIKIVCLCGKVRIQNARLDSRRETHLVFLLSSVSFWEECKHHCISSLM